VPEQLIERMRAAPCIRLELPLPARVRLLIEDYDFFVRDIDAFCARLDALRVLRGAEVVKGWQADAHAGRIEQVVHDLLVRHYDPGYLASMRRNFGSFEQPVLALAWDGSAESLDAAARQIAAAG
jgi:tRNA 2-selenouridine synthase